MAVSKRILFQIILVILLSGIKVYERSYLNKKLFAASSFYFSYPFNGLLCCVIGIINTGLILCASVITLSVFDRRVDNIKVGQQQSIKAYLLGIILHTYRFSESCISFTYLLIIGVSLTSSIGVAALSVNNSWYWLHKIFHPPEAAAGQVYHIFCCIHIHALLIFHFYSISSWFIITFHHLCFLRSITMGHTAAQQKYWSGDYDHQFFIHCTNLLFSCRTRAYFSGLRPYSVHRQISFLMAEKKISQPIPIISEYITSKDWSI